MARRLSRNARFVLLLVITFYLGMKFTQLQNFMSELQREADYDFAQNPMPVMPVPKWLKLRSPRRDMELTTSNVIKSETPYLKRHDHFIFPDNVKVELVSDTGDWDMKERYNRTVTCPGTKRSISFHRSYKDYNAISSAHVVHVMTGASSAVWRRLQDIRKPSQIWLYSSAESPPYSPPFPAKNDKPWAIAMGLKFNMSFFYHPKAEVHAPFGAYVPFDFDQLKLLKYVKIAPKQETDVLAAWASSHCHYRYWNRTGFAYELSRYVKIDLYGDCGTKPLPRDEVGNAILRRYKFYLALENMCCSYYISEKFWLALSEYEAVPVVIGSPKTEYEKVAPPNSFIHADDFYSFQDLANYLTRVANDESLYMQYHKWREFGYARVFHSHNVFPYFEDKMGCRLLDYLERTAWKPDRPMQMELDLYGPDWLGSCNTCGLKPWLLDYNLKSKQYRENFTMAIKRAKLIAKKTKV